jgi:hypothetical protein
MTKKIPTIRELLDQLATIQQSNPIEIEEIKRSDRHNPFFDYTEQTVSSPIISSTDPRNTLPLI